MAKQKLSYPDLYNEIVKYYPLGVNYLQPEYQQFPGTVLLHNLCDNKTKTNEYVKWREMLSGLKKRREVISQSVLVSAPYAPSHSGKLLLEKEKHGKVIYTREIHCHISILAPFYSIYGVDRVVLKSSSDHVLDFDPIIYVSPLQVYEAGFTVIRSEIEAAFPGYQFLSYSFLRTRVEGLYLPGSHMQFAEKGSVFQAFFLPYDITMLKFKGDPLYQ